MLVNIGSGVSILKVSYKYSDKSPSMGRVLFF